MERVKEYKKPEYVKLGDGGELDVHPANTAVGIIVAIAVIAIAYA